MRRTRAFSPIIAFVILGSCGCRRVETYRDKNVAAWEIRLPFGLVLPHRDVPRYLEVAGKAYKGVRGLAPYYLSIPQLDSILFVTEAPKYRAVIHIVNLKTKREVAVETETSFGSSIGSPRRPGEPMTNYIEKVEPPRIVIADRSLDWKSTMVLNLDAGTVERRETEIYDREGRLTKRYVNSQLVP